MKKINLAYLLIVFTIFISACAKDGDTGPQGPAGTNGTNGVDGNANVKSQIFTVYSGDWYYASPSYGVDLFNSDITQDIVDNGFVMAYISNGSGGWQALPYTAYPNSSYASTYVFIHYINGVTIWKTDSDLTQPTNPGTRTYKVIAVAEALRIANPDVDWRDYEQAKMFINE